MSTKFSDLISSEQPTLVDFSAEWCGPCKMMAPILKDVASKVGDLAKIIKVDVDRNPSAAAFYEISGVPTLILFQNGEIKWRQSGVVSAAQLEKVIRAHAQ